MDKPKSLLGYKNAKIEKSNRSGKGYFTAIMYLAPNVISGFNVCPHATPQCIKTCLVTSSYHMNMDHSQKARLERTTYFFENRQGFKAMLYGEIKKHVTRSLNKGLIPAIRLNGTSDLVWETIFPDMFLTFSNVIFYDYTKFPIHKRTNLPNNYFLTRSHSEKNHSELTSMVQGGNVAVVFNTLKKEKLPKKWMGFNVFDGDVDDLRFLDPKNVIVGLRAKGKAKKEKATKIGFVVKV